MILIRSLLLAVYMGVLTPLYALIATLSFPFKPLTRYRIIRTWGLQVMWVVAKVCGIRYKVIGRENLPLVPVVFVVKHQSAWETIALQEILPPVSFVLKRELLKIPFFGWGLAQFSPIAIDRSAGREALEQIVNQGRERFGEGFSVVIFPEGTRTAIGTKRRYLPGGGWLAQHTNTAVVPIAHNAGEFWRKNAFLKHPGQITVSIGPVIQTEGLSASEINARTEEWIEGEMHRLFPHHYKDKAAAKAAATRAN